MDCQGRGTTIRFIHYRETLYPWPVLTLNIVENSTSPSNACRAVFFVIGRSG
jgi:hypothetical protein